MSNALPRLLINWLAVKKHLKETESEELELRRKICQNILGNEFGTKTVTLESHQLTATQEVKRIVDEKSLKMKWQKLPAEERKAVRFTPGIINKVYDNIDIPNLKGMVTEKLLPPSLEYKDIKG